MRFHDIRRGRRDDARPARRAKKGGAPGIEALEGRVVLAVSTWSGAVSNLWSVGGNWADNSTPINGNDLAFPSTGLHTTNQNDLTTANTFGAVTLSGSGYTITGSQVTLAGPIASTQPSGGDQFNLPIELGNDLAVSVADAPATLTLGGVIDGAHGLTKSGVGTADLTAANTYTGATTVGAGTLLIDGAQAGSAVTVNAGATLGGVGTVGGITGSGGIVSPGDGGPGILTDSGALTLSASSSFSVPINGTTAGTGYSQLQAAGPINLGNAALVVTVGGTAPIANEQYTLIHNTGGAAITGTFAGLPEGATKTFNNQTFRISYAGGTGHDVVLTHLVTTSTTISSSTQTTTFGTVVTFTAHVAAVGGTGTPTGSVQFFNNGSTTPLGTGTVDSSGDATLNTAALPIDTNHITADYTGDAGFAPSTTTAAATVTVSKALTATALTVVPTTSVFGQSVALKATVTSTTSGLGTPTGTVEFLNGTTEIETVRMDSTGVATLNTSSLPVGSDVISAIYESDDTFAASTSPNVTATVTATPTTTTLAVSPAQPTLGQTVDLTATVVVTSPNTGTPTGTVSFSDVTPTGTISLGTATLSGGVATLATTGLIGGSNSITATYNTNGSFASSTSTATVVTIPQAASTTALAIAPNPSSFGQSVTLAAAVAGVGVGPLQPTGTVQFFAGTTSLGTATLESGIASLQTTTLPIGASSITADYLGSASFTASASPAVVANVSLALPLVAVTTSIPNPGPTQTVVLTATVVSGLAGNTPTGTVIFFGNGANLGSATLTGGTGSITLKNLPVGNEAITVQYLGDANNASRTSDTLTVPIGTPLEQYINGIYLNVLGRPVDTGNGQILKINNGGLAAWLTKFVQGAARRSPIVNAILLSKETRQFGVQATYTHVAGKQATSPQLQNAFLGANGTTLNLSSRVFGGPAYFAAAGSTVSGFLSALGTDVLGTPLPDATVTIFTNELNHGVSRSTVARQLLQSPSGKLSQINGLYQRILNRLADLGGIKTSFAILNDGKSDDRILANLLSSQEYVNTFFPTTTTTTTSQ